MAARHRATECMAAGMAVLVLLAGCSGKKKATKENFTTAINTWYYGHDDCLFPSAIRFPYEVSMSDKSSQGAKGMDALMHAGLLEREESTSIKINRYTLTPAGQRAGARFCYGHREVSSIDSFTPPQDANGERSSQVEYHYQMRDVPSWAKSQEMARAFPQLAKALSGDATATDKLVLTMAGWQRPE